MQNKWLGRSLLILSIGLASCQFLPFSGSWSSTSTEHTIDTAKGKANYSIAYLSYNDRTYLVLLSQSTGGSAIGGGTTSQYGEFVQLNERDRESSRELNRESKSEPKAEYKIEWTCHTSDGKQGTVTIGNQQFELQQGAVFLIRMQNRQLQDRQLQDRQLQDRQLLVEQVAVDMAHLQGKLSAEQISKVAQANPQIAAFLSTVSPLP